MFSQLAINHRGNSQRLCKTRMTRLINLRRIPGQNNGIGSCQKRQRRRHTKKLTSMNLYLKFRDRVRKIHSLFYVLHKILNFFISLRCFAEVPKCKMHVQQVVVLLIRAYCSTLHSALAALFTAKNVPTVSKNC